MATPIITDGSTDRVHHAPRVVLPGRDVFAARAERFAQLARGSAVAEYLALLARVSAGQQRALQARESERVSDGALAASRDFGMPPLSSQAHARSECWRADLADVLAVARAGAGTAVASTLDRLAEADAVALEGYADRLLAGTAPADEAAIAPFVGAALQTYFTRLAASLDVAWIENCDVSGFCPTCASRPVASVVRIGGERANLRYLVCSLCATEWHVARIQCTSCSSEGEVKYLALQSQEDARGAPATRAEACDACKSYLKIFYQEQDPNLEPMADDLATIALDLVVDEQGYARSGPNLLFHPGAT
jgi:FdhE protein